MRLKEALSVLSKSSPFAVSTERDGDTHSQLEEIKSYLYIEMPIEKHVDEVISSFGANDKKILFLCGSSGDGKSELLTKAKEKYSQRVNFHLDATHSFDPHGTAIQTLDNEFLKFEQGNKPLVVGINTGMLGNYAEEGQNETIRASFARYLQNRNFETQNIKFINFEDYPKFAIRENGYDSDFAQKLLQRLTQKNDNIIRQLVEKERQLGDYDSQRVLTNFEMLSIPSVQRVIIDLLFKARLMRDQFLTARALLDFIHELLLADGYLFDNLFAGGGNELANKIQDFDPANLRTKEIDRFILAFDLNLSNEEFEEFKEAIKLFGIEGLTSGAQYLRLFYILKYDDFANNYHKKYQEDFNASLIDQYISVYQLHKGYTGSPEQKSELKVFYRDTLIAAIRAYINRNAPKLGKKYYLLSDFGEYQVAAPADLSMDSDAIRQNTMRSSAFFNARLKLKSKQFILPININLLSLLLSINNGYRPNKHDKNSVILLDELANEIIQEAKSACELVITGEGRRYQLELNDEEIMVSEV
ncbi:DNA phosphorothioation-dependent restriction protein DptF [Alteromonas aestuariivivens]|uniref:DNA phosphorothioation-dependent restriction protein DptF n=2 Tax=Alteromonas aestuariivivens TaxID=1938339 RepID=A0A3D8M4A9_9ALTE|nr:DNA phosphorothioation-dependent restriction protein DptF [Alteromonas aestuariivivens]